MRTKVRSKGHKGITKLGQRLPEEWEGLQAGDPFCTTPTRVLLPSWDLPIGPSLNLRAPQFPPTCASLGDPALDVCECVCVLTGPVQMWGPPAPVEVSPPRSIQLAPPSCSCWQGLPGPTLEELSVYTQRPLGHRVAPWRTGACQGNNK